jgi:hypothetical protein
MGEPSQSKAPARHFFSSFFPLACSSASLPKPYPKLPVPTGGWLEKAPPKTGIQIIAEAHALVQQVVTRHEEVKPAGTVAQGQAE